MRICPVVQAFAIVVQGNFTFRNTFLGTLLKCTYKKGEATFMSDSLTGLAIVKEVLTKEATARKIKIQISIDVKDDTIISLLKCALLTWFAMRLLSTRDACLPNLSQRTDH